MQPAATRTPALAVREVPSKTEIRNNLVYHTDNDGITRCYRPIYVTKNQKTPVGSSQLKNVKAIIDVSGIVTKDLSKIVVKSDGKIYRNGKPSKFSRKGENSRYNEEKTREVADLFKVIVQDVVAQKQPAAAPAAAGVPEPVAPAPAEVSAPVTAPGSTQAATPPTTTPTAAQATTPPEAPAAGKAIAPVAAPAPATVAAPGSTPISTPAAAQATPPPAAPASASLPPLPSSPPPLPPATEPIARLPQPDPNDQLYGTKNKNDPAKPPAEDLGQLELQIGSVFGTRNLNADDIKYLQKLGFTNHDKVKALIIEKNVAHPLTHAYSISFLNHLRNRAFLGSNELVTTLEKLKNADFSIGDEDDSIIQAIEDILSYLKRQKITDFNSLQDFYNECDETGWGIKDTCHLLIQRIARSQTKHPPGDLTEKDFEMLTERLNYSRPETGKHSGLVNEHFIYRQEKKGNTIVYVVAD